MDKNIKPKDFWITNASKMDVMLSDLGLSVKSYKSVNLLDSKHYHVTWEQILKSISGGSLYKKRDKIFVRNSSPLNNIISNNKKMLDEESIIPNREKSVFEIKEEKFEELNLTDEQFAEEQSNM